MCCAEERGGDAVVEPVDAVADVVQVAGDGRQLGLARRVAEPQQHVLGGAGDDAAVPRPVLGVAEHAQVLVRLVDEDLDLVVAAHVVERHRRSWRSGRHLPHLEAVKGLVRRGVARPSTAVDPRRRRAHAAPVEHGVDGGARRPAGAGRREPSLWLLTQPRRPQSAALARARWRGSTRPAPTPLTRDVHRLHRPPPRRSGRRRGRPRRPALSAGPRRPRRRAGRLRALGLASRTSGTKRQRVSCRSSNASPTRSTIVSTWSPCGSPDGHHQPAAVGELPEQLRRHLVGGGRHQDAVERRLLVPAPARRRRWRGATLS